MALADKIYAYFDRNPRLHVLFVFDSDFSRLLTTELEEISWKPGYRLVVFDGLSWLGTKVAIENEWKDDKIIIVFHRLSPSGSTNTDTFPLSGLLAANAEYRNEGYEQFMQHNGIPDEYAKIVRDHIDEFDRDKYAKILRPYFNADDFKPDPIMRGLASAYMGESKMLTWDEIILKMILWDAETDYAKKADTFYTQLTNHPDVLDRLQTYITDIFGSGIPVVTGFSRMKKIAEAMKYNSIVQLLPLYDADNYKSLRISDSLKLDRLNRLVETSRTLPKQRREAYEEAFGKLSADVRESEILSVYGADADYYQVSEAMADAMIYSVVEETIAIEPDKALNRLINIRAKIENYENVCKAADYAITIAKFYEKVSRLGSVIYNSPDEYIHQYSSDLYLFDTYYRTSIAQFHALSDTLECYTALDTAKRRLDKVYARIANKINTEWVRCLKDKGNGYGEVSSAVRQEDFFSGIIEPTGKQVLIICDAFRYELAKDLIEKIISKKKGKGRYQPKLTPGLAMLPTETKYCKSALLPHDDLEIHDLTLSVDHKILDDTPSRMEQIKAYMTEAEYVDYYEVQTADKEKCRSMFAGVKLFVMFYDEVDHIGHGNAPRKVVGTCAEAIEDLAYIIGKIHDNGNVSHIYLTSDHGFLYNDMIFEDKDKLDVNDSDLEKKSRYYLTVSDADIPGITKFPLANVSGMHAEVNVAVPDGTNRIKVRGGDYNFAHGGASLQEVIIPILHSYAPKSNAKVSTGVSLLGRNLSVVSSRLKVQLLQDDAVSETIKERTVSVALYHGDTMVSNEVVKTLASTNADQARDRIFDFDLTLLQSGGDILKLKVFDVDSDTSRLNPLITETVTDNTLIPLDF